MTSNNKEAAPRYHNSMSLPEWIELVRLQKVESYELLQQEYLKSNRLAQLKAMAADTQDNVIPFRAIEIYDSERARILEALHPQVSDFYTALLNIKPLDLHLAKRDLDLLLAKTFSSEKNHYLVQLFGAFLTRVF